MRHFLLERSKVNQGHDNNGAGNLRRIDCFNQLLQSNNRGIFSSMQA